MQTAAQNLLLEGIGLHDDAQKRKVLERAVGEYDKALAKLNKVPTTDSDEFNKSVQGVREVLLGDLVITYNELCDLELNAGNKKEAREWNDKALKLEPGNWHAQDLKKRLGS
jgi:tetratricopeptide (TPR) repeat protein